MHLDDFALRKIAFICALGGVMLVFVISSAFEPTELEIGEINSVHLNQTVSVQGKVSSRKIISNALIFELTENKSTINAVKFNANENELLIEKGSKVKVTGKVEEYKGELEIVAEEIKEIK
ncbi:MAG: OB-fold nucleic acid binding domain-containing protein [Candidatus Diapherotrites archaeon]